MSLQHSYRLLAPFYDLVAGPLFRRARAVSLARLPSGINARVLIDGAGTGLDFPYLPAQHEYVALDLTPQMLQRARQRTSSALDVRYVEGDCLHLPFRDAAFDCVVLHLILAVVPDGAAALREAWRVVKPNGEILILDKFLRRGARAPLRTLLSPVLGSVLTRTDVVFEDLLKATPGARVVHDAPALAGGWFRYITVQRAA